MVFGTKEGDRPSREKEYDRLGLMADDKYWMADG